MTDRSGDAGANQVRAMLMAWAEATRTNDCRNILRGHHADVRIFDVLKPMSYEGAEAYRASWDSWQPETQGENIFEFTELNVVAGIDVAFANGFIKCGGTLKDGEPFEDLVRATFCL